MMKYQLKNDRRRNPNRVLFLESKLHPALVFNPKSIDLEQQAEGFYDVVGGMELYEICLMLESNYTQT